MENNCYKCDTVISDQTAVKCTTCNAHFHSSCANSSDKPLNECIRCTSVKVIEKIATSEVSTEPKSDELVNSNKVTVPVNESPGPSILPDTIPNEHNKAKQNISSKRSENSNSSGKSSKSNRSTKSAKLQMLLEIAEEKKKMELEFIAQQEKLLAAKRRANEAFITQKEKIISLMDEMSVLDNESSTKSEQRNSKVNEWLEASSTTVNINPPAVTFSSSSTVLKTYVTDVYKQPITSSNMNLPTSNQIPHTFTSTGETVRREATSFIPENQPTTMATPLTSTSIGEVIRNRVPFSLSKEVLAARQSDTRWNLSFDGNPKNWPTFYNQYNLSNQQCKYTDIDNIIRLKNGLKGRAYRAVQGALSHPSNVSYIMKTLEQLFGKPEFIINELIKDIREFPPLKLEKFGETVEFSLLVRNMCMTMQGAGMSNHLWNPNLLQDLVTKLPIQLQREWAQYNISFPVSNIESFSFWIQSKANECALLLTEPPNFGEGKQKKASVLFQDNNQTHSECFCCKGDCKDVTMCEKFNNLTYKEKYDVVNTNLLCKKCLKKHRNPCLRRELCGVNGCAYKHHPQLHKPSESDVHQVNTHDNDEGSSIFKIVPVTLHNDEKSLSTYALLDDGSSVTLIDSSVAESLNLKGTPQPLCLKWTSDTQRLELDSISISFQISGSNGKKLIVNQARTVSTLNLPCQSLSSVEMKSKYKHLRGIPIESYQGARPTLLIGLNNVHLMLPHKTRSGADDEPVAIKSQLGWVVFGEKGVQSSNHEVYHVCECKQDKLEDILREYIAIENLNISTPKIELLSKDDERALSILEQTTKYSDNRYEVGLLWKYEKFSMPFSLGMALSRLKCFEKQMEKNANLRQQMQKQIDEYLANGYIREITDTEDVESGREWFLPIFAVKNPNKPKKVRMVWDAAATVNNMSLNSFLLKGPDNLVNLPGVLFRFRQFEIAVVGDIKHMFHQIKMRKEDQNFLKFLWSSNDGNVRTYVMQVMCFGPSCSPASAQYIKNINADKYSAIYPRAVESIKDNHYVDDMLESVCSINEAKDLVEQVKLIHQSGGFEIRNFLSNSTEVLNFCTQNDANSGFILPENNTEKVLGMWWNFKKDTFKYSLKYNKGNVDILKGKVVPTKRQVLQVLMSIYDPLGLISHYLIYPKILLQQVWKSGINWDEKIPEDLYNCWAKWTNNLQSLKKIKIPRWYGISKSTSNLQLHIFVDASLEAYAAAAYIRFPSCDGMRCRLISAKTKVAPLKTLSVPRLELNAALIGARLSSQIKKSHSISFDATYFWTDSKSVWCWIRSETRKYKPYVAYRVAEILDLSSSHQWKWLSTDLNVADKATRQVIHTIKNKCEWFRGPKFLRCSEDSWPCQPTSDTTNEELRPHFMLHISQNPVEICRFSKWNRLRRTMAYVKRFVHNMLSTKNLQQRCYGELPANECSVGDECAIEILLERRQGIFSSIELIRKQKKSFTESLK